MTAFYLDASAVIKEYVQEAGSEFVISVLAQRRGTTSTCQISAPLR